MTSVLVPESLDDLISATEAANDLGCQVSTISKWVARGHLEPSGLDRSGRKLFRRIDVLKAEQKTRRRALGGRAA